MADSRSLARYGDLSLIVRYAKLFSLDADFVFENCSFDSVCSILSYEKEQHEFEERYSEFYYQLTKDTNVPTAQGTKRGKQ